MTRWISQQQVSEPVLFCRCDPVDLARPNNFLQPWRGVCVCLHASIPVHIWGWDGGAMLCFLFERLGVGVNSRWKGDHVICLSRQSSNSILWLFYLRFLQHHLGLWHLLRTQAVIQFHWWRKRGQNVESVSTMTSPLYQYPLVQIILVLRDNEYGVLLVNCIKMLLAIPLNLQPRDSTGEEWLRMIKWYKGRLASVSIRYTTWTWPI